MKTMKYIYGIILVLFVLSTHAQDSLKRPDIPGELMLDIGFNVWSSMPEPLKKRTWSSKSIALYYTNRKALSNKFSFNYGIGMGMEKMSLGDSSTLFSNLKVKEVVHSVYINPNTHDFKKNMLAITYLDIPIEFRFHPLGTEDGEGLFIGIGGIAGVRLAAHTKWKYDNNGQTVREKNSGKFNLNAFRYGYQVRAGFRGVHLFYKRYVSSVFNDPLKDGFDPVMTTVGINFTGF